MPEDISGYYKDLSDDDLLLAWRLYTNALQIHSLLGTSATIPLYVPQWRD
jgi:hypothetical protein